MLTDLWKLCFMQYKRNYHVFLLIYKKLNFEADYLSHIKKKNHLPCHLFLQMWADAYQNISKGGIVSSPSHYNTSSVKWSLSVLCNIKAVFYKKKIILDAIISNVLTFPCAFIPVCLNHAKALKYRKTPMGQDEHKQPTHTHTHSTVGAQGIWVYELLSGWRKRRKRILESILQTSRQQEEDRRRRTIGGDNEGEHGMNGVAD